MWVVCLVALYIGANVLSFKVLRMPPEAAANLFAALQNASVVRELLICLVLHIALLAMLVLAAAPLRTLLIRRWKIGEGVAGVTAAMTACGVAFAWNQWWFDYSRSAELLAPWALLPVMIGASALMVFGWLDYLSLQGGRRLAYVAGVGGALALWLHGAPDWEARAGTAPAPVPASPNVFIIGIDSLSRSVLQAHEAQLPHMARMWRGSQRYLNAQTPLACTCPAWMTVLSGKSPAEHGAVFNLRDVSFTETRDLLSQTLRQSGYRTVFAIDERRFCYIDERLGFDAVVGPALGILDFLFQQINDTPLTNAVMQWRPMARWFQYNTLNVASSANYNADAFIDAVLGAVEGPRQPVMLAVHLESAHFPYRSRHAGIGKDDEIRGVERQLTALQVVDRQLGQLMDGFARRGLLEDALVILLSDHGESFGDAYPVQRLDGQVVSRPGHGHGAYLLKAEENNVVLGVSHFRHGVPQGAGGESNDQVSLAGVRQVVEEFVADGKLPPLPKNECLMVETGMRFEAVADLDHFDETALMKQAAEFYESTEGGQLRLREDQLAKLIEGKDVARVCGETLTLYEAKGQTWRAYQRSADAAREVAVRSEDVLAIEGYRDRLRQLVRSAH